MSATIPLFRPFHCEQMDAAAASVLQSGQIAAGAHVLEFQRELGKRVGNPQVLTTSDMSSAMQIALRLANVGPGDDVLTTAFTCMSSNAPIAALGASPRWVDVEATTGRMDPNDLLKALTPQSKACVVYHTAGYPADVAGIKKICEPRGIAVIEDCNNALGASINGRHVGSIGDMAIYSFYPNRQINAGEGGAIAIRDASALTRATRLRRFGIDMSSFRDGLGEINPSSDIPEIGWSASMNNLNSAIALAQLENLDDRMRKTQKNAEELIHRIKSINSLRAVESTINTSPAYWTVLILAEPRDTVLAHLKTAGIMASKLHHRNDGYSGFRAKSRDLPGTTDFMSKVLALPCGWWLTQTDIKRITTTLAQAVA